MNKNNIPILYIRKSNKHSKPRMSILKPSNELLFYFTQKLMAWERENTNREIMYFINNFDPYLNSITQSLNAPNSILSNYSNTLINQALNAQSNGCCTQFISHEISHAELNQLLNSIERNINVVSHTLNAPINVNACYTIFNNNSSIENVNTISEELEETIAVNNQRIVELERELDNMAREERNFLFPTLPPLPNQNPPENFINRTINRIANFIVNHLNLVYNRFNH